MCWSPRARLHAWRLVGQVWGLSTTVWGLSYCFARRQARVTEMNESVNARFQEYDIPQAPFQSEVQEGLVFGAFVNPADARGAEREVVGVVEPNVSARVS